MCRFVCASLIALGLLTMGCISRMEDVKIEDYGKQQIGENLYLKKIVLNSNDRVYILVDGDDKLVSANTSTSFSVSNGKSTTTYSNSFIHQ